MTLAGLSRGTGTQLRGFGRAPVGRIPAFLKVVGGKDTDPHAWELMAADHFIGVQMQAAKSQHVPAIWQTWEAQRGRKSPYSDYLKLLLSSTNVNLLSG